MTQNDTQNDNGRYIIKQELKKKKINSKYRNNPKYWDR